MRQVEREPTCGRADTRMLSLCYSHGCLIEASYRATKYFASSTIKSMRGIN